MSRKREIQQPTDNDKLPGQRYQYYPEKIFGNCMEVIHMLATSREGKMSELP